MAQQTDQTMLAVLALAVIYKRVGGHIGQAKGITEFTIGKQSGVGCDPRAMKLKLQAAIEIEAQRRHIGFTLWVQHLTRPSPTQHTDMYTTIAQCWR